MKCEEFKMGPQTLKYLLNMIRSGMEKYGVFQVGLPIILSKSFKFLNLFFICIAILVWLFLSTNSLTFNKAGACLNVSISLDKCFQGSTYMAAFSLDQVAVFTIFISSYLFALTIN